VDANLPAHRWHLGADGIFFTVPEMTQLGALSLLGKVLPGRKTGECDSHHSGVPWRASAKKMWEVVEAVLPRVMSRIKPDSLARLQAPQERRLAARAYEWRSAR